VTREWKDDFELEVEATALGLHLQAPRLDAQTETIIHRMWLGDFRPLAAAIAGGDEGVHPAVGYELLRLIDEDQLNVKQRRRGARQQPDLLARKLQMFIAYEGLRGSGDTSGKAFEKVATEFGIGVESVRQAVTEIRKRLREPKTPKAALSLDDLKAEARKQKPI
jgi:hypothetical protein